MELKVDMPSLAGQDIDPATFQRVWDRVRPPPLPGAAAIPPASPIPPSLRSPPFPLRRRRSPRRTSRKSRRWIRRSPRSCRLCRIVRISPTRRTVLRVRSVPSVPSSRGNPLFPSSPFCAWGRPPRGTAAVWSS